MFLQVQAVQDALGEVHLVWDTKFIPNWSYDTASLADAGTAFSPTVTMAFRVENMPDGTLQTVLDSDAQIVASQVV